MPSIEMGTHGPWVVGVVNSSIPIEAVVVGGQGQGISRCRGGSGGCGRGQHTGKGCGDLAGGCGQGQHMVVLVVVHSRVQVDGNQHWTERI